MAPLMDAYISPADGALIPEPDIRVCYRRHLHFVSDMGKRSFILCYPEIQRIGACVTATASDVSDSNDSETFGKSGLPRAGFGLCETADVVCA